MTAVESRPPPQPSALLTGSAVLAGVAPAVFVAIMGHGEGARLLGCFVASAYIVCGVSVFYAPRDGIRAGAPVAAAFGTVALILPLLPDSMVFLLPAFVLWSIMTWRYADAAAAWELVVAGLAGGATVLAVLVPVIVLNRP